MTPNDIPMTAPSLVPASLSAVRSDLLEAAAFFLRNPATQDAFEVLVGDVMLRKPAVADLVFNLSAVYREAGDLDPTERLAAQIEYARAIMSDSQTTPGRKVSLLTEALYEPKPERLAAFVLPAAAPAPAVTSWGNGAEALDLLGEALQALQHMTLGQLRANKISTTLLDRIEAVVVHG